MAEDIMVKNRNQHENHLAIGPSIGIGIDVDIDSHSSNYIEDQRSNNNLGKNVNRDVTAQTNARTDIAHSENSAFSHLRPTLSEMENNNRSAIAEQGNLLSMAQSVRNLGFVPNMNMNFNHQQINALNASLNAAGTLNNVNFPRLRNPMFVPDVNVSLSNTNGFPNNHHGSFPAEFVPLSQNHNHNPFIVTEDNNSTAIHRAGQTGERYYGRQPGLTQGPPGDAATTSNGQTNNTSNKHNINSDSKTENRRRGVEDRGVSNLPLAKRARNSEQRQHLGQTSSTTTSGQWVNGSGRSYSLFVQEDERNLSQYQCLARKQMEIFEATSEDAGNNAQGRNRPILPGQIGIRCRHCYKLPPKQRKTGSVYYPNRLEGVYQTAQKMTVGHLCKHCTMIPDEIRERLLFLKDQKSSDGGGKRYWANGVRSLGVVETPSGGLSFAKLQSPNGLKGESNNTNGIL